jgi:threonine/homoserine/homoserine lactone efflux protein
MFHAIATFLLQATLISLSGVLAPGPMTAATLAAGARSRHAGAWIALGHGIVEFPLMGLTLAGAGALLVASSFRIGVGLAGGAALLLMAALTLASLRRPADQPATGGIANPLWTGVLFTGSNPYFLLWWATVGLTLATRAFELGILAFALFAVVHWLCDLAWLEALSLASYQGTGLLGPKSQRVVLLVCSAAMTVFGTMFLFDAFKALRA